MLHIIGAILLCLLLLACIPFIIRFLWPVTIIVFIIAVVVVFGSTLLPILAVLLEPICVILVVCGFCAAFLKRIGKGGDE